jgi:antitoxin (DNA-binding transcriptional repressor) of toxin-antitoxin stability system
MSQYNIHMVKAHLSELIQRAMMGEEIIIAKDNKPIARITAFNPVTNQRKVGLAKGMIKLSKDFDEPLDDFEDYK